MSVSKLEAFLARIYVDQEMRERFLNAPEDESKRAGLSSEECEAVKQIDRVGLELMATSLKRKKERSGSCSKPSISQ